MVPLADVPSQAFTVTLEQERWSFRFVTAGGMLVADVARDGVLLLTGTRVLAGEPIIPYRYLQTGNFLFLDSREQIPTTQSPLAYLSAAEIAAIEANPLTMADITPTVVSFLTTDDGFYLVDDLGNLLEDE